VTAIERRGLLCGKSMGKRPVVWLPSPAQSFRAALHTVRRHGGRVEAVVILLVGVPRAWLWKSRKGLWSSVHDIPADRIRRVLSFAELASAYTMRCLPSRGPIAQGPAEGPADHAGSASAPLVTAGP
jgi:hypothetical protein